MGAGVAGTRGLGLGYAVADRAGHGKQTTTGMGYIRGYYVPPRDVVGS